MAGNYDYASLFSYGGSPAGGGSPNAFDPNFVPGFNPSNTGVPSFIPNYGGGGVQPGMPKTPPSTPMPQLGWNMDTLKTGLGVVQTGANIYSAFEQASLAKQQLAYAKEMGTANLANQMKSYNTNLTSQANMSAKVGGWTPEQTAAYLAANKLTGK